MTWEGAGVRLGSNSLPNILWSCVDLHRMASRSMNIVRVWLLRVWLLAETKAQTSRAPFVMIAATASGYRLNVQRVPRVNMAASKPVIVEYRRDAADTLSARDELLILSEVDALVITKVHLSLVSPHCPTHCVL